MFPSFHGEIRRCFYGVFVAFSGVFFTAFFVAFSGRAT
jgi:hypothetical protein